MASQLQNPPCQVEIALHEAFKSYVRARDYCTTPSHISATCLNAVKVSVELQNFTNVACYVAKAEQTPDVKVNPPSPFSHCKAKKALNF